MSTSLVPSHLAEPVVLALGRLDPQRYAAALRAFDAAHADALRVLSGEEPTAQPTVSREALLAKAAIDPAAAIELSEAIAKVRLPYIDAGGNVWGFGTLQQLDPRWLLAVLAWLYYPVFEVVPFPEPPDKQPQVISAPDTMDVAILGDWGGGPESAAPVVLEQVRMLSPQPTYTIHLGDVYYFGAPSTGFGGLIGGHAEMVKFVDPWATGTAGSFTLNSNHEMYAAANGYFKDALTSPKFALQNGMSYFAAENDEFVIVGLDSAYYSPWEGFYFAGNLNAGQLEFLAAQARKTTKSGQPKKLVILTHHTGLDDDGTQETALWSQVVGALPAGTTAYWYWGHYHEAAVYTTRTQNGVTIYPRCAGHGCYPYGNASALAAALVPRPNQPPTVIWYETTSVDPGGPNAIFMVNGFANLSFDGPNLTETFIDQNGGKYVVGSLEPTSAS
jgi:hypothetical protein